MSKHSELQQSFDVLGIDTTRPGFYDDPRFVEQERQNPRFLQRYAEFVNAIPFDEQYLAKARSTVRALADYLFEELKRDGRKGACIDVSGTAMRMLEKEGIWSYMAEGAAIIHFPESSHLRRRYFWPLMHPGNPAKTGHVWLSVPPFKVVDVSLPIQPYTPEEAKYLTRIVAAEKVGPAPATTIGDLMETELIEHFMRLHHRRPTLRDIAPALREFMAKFRPFQIMHDGCLLRYVPTSVSAMDSGLAGMKNLCLRGKYPADLYREFRERGGVARA